jgi:hypothetical protein
MTIKSGKDILSDALMKTGLNINKPSDLEIMKSFLQNILEAIDSNNAEILAVIKPIANKPYSYDAKMWNDFYNLVSELEAKYGN